MELREAIAAARTHLEDPFDRSTLALVLRTILDAYEEMNNAICWDTQCLNCAALLDANYQQYVKLDKIRAVLQEEL